MNIWQHNKIRGKRTKLRRHSFTLIELLISMVILLIMMGMLLYIVSTAQRNYHIQEARTRMHQKSRLVFDLLEQDIRSIITSSAVTGANQDEKQIGYHVFTHDAANVASQRVLCMVTNTEPKSGASSRACEVTYAFHSDATEPNSRFQLRRQIVSAGDNYWDFVDQPTGWATNPSDAIESGGGSFYSFDTVIDGVAGFDIQFESDSGAAVVGDNTSQPVRATINLVLFDETMSDSSYDSIRSRTQRGFTKVLYLRHIHSR